MAPMETENGDAPFPNMLSEFVYTRTYSRWVPELGRRERWHETVDRYVNFLREERDLPEHVLKDIRHAILRMDVMPSMRALWSAGDAARRDNTMMYNCSFTPLDSLRSFAELLYILMMGTGAGFSVERRFVNNLPEVSMMTGEQIEHVVPDSTDGWADSFYFLLENNFKGITVRFDYSEIRPAGAILKTKGGRASGPGPLKRLFDFTQKTVLGAQGRKLTSLECHDIACMVGEIVMSGGVRRAALISFSDPDDDLIRYAKKFPTCHAHVPLHDEEGNPVEDADGNPVTHECGWGWSNDLSDGKHLMEEHGMTVEEYQKEHPNAYMGFGSQRFMANNSAFWDSKPTREVFQKEWDALVASGSGERGFYMIPPHKASERRGEVRSNPCGEILLRFLESLNAWTGEGGGGQFCNLSAAVMRAHDTRESFAEKVRIATWIGAIQSSFTHFPYLRPGWSQTCEEDRLLGVDITGQCDNPELSNDTEAMAYFNQVARETAAQAAAYLGINMPASITCGKPSGNSSQLLDCASGFHARFAPYYIRRVRINATDPLFHLIRTSGIPVHKDNAFTHLPDEECPTWVAEFLVKAPEGAVLREDETAIEMLERYLHIMKTWCNERGHNQSVTVYVKDNEWDAVGDWVFEHFDEITGISFLPYDGGKYSLAPYEEITEEQYMDMLVKYPEVDFSLLSVFEQEDRGEGSRELACMGGACEL